MGIFLATCSVQSLPAGVEGRPPKRVCLVPAPGPDGLIRGRDGRAWRYSDPIGLLRGIKAKGLAQLVLDEKHASEPTANPAGIPWQPLAHVPVDSLSVNAEGEIWGLPEWTEYGAERHADYEGVSPAFLYDSDTADEGSGILGSLVGMSSAGLVEGPNFDLPVSLNTAQHPNNTGKNGMDLKEMAKILGLPDDATEAQILDAARNLAQPQVAPVTEQVAANAAQPPPWALALNQEISALRAEVQSAKGDGHKVAVNSAIDRFTKEGKLLPTPEARAFAESACATAEGLANFVKFYESAPAIVNGDVGLNNAQVPGAAPVMTETARKLLQASGLSPEAFNRPYKDGV